MTSKETEKAASESVIINGLTQTKIVCTENNTLEIYRLSQSGGPTEVLKQIKLTDAAIVTVKQAPLQYRPYILIVDADLRITLYNIQDKHSDPVFDFVEESSEVGYFTAAEFFNGSKDSLKFIVGTSTGAALVFSSDKNFQDERVYLGSGAVRLLAAGPGDTFASFCQLENPRIYFNANMANPVEFGQNLHESKRVSHLAFQPFLNDQSLLLISGGEDLKVGLWEASLATKQINLTASFNLTLAPISLGWAISGVAATIVLGKKTTSEEQLSFCRLEKNLALANKENQWSLKEVSLEK